MAQYKTPGVYVEEKSMLPPSVAGVATAVPAFIGYTEKQSSNAIQPITSLLEYETLFGGAKKLTYDKDAIKGHEYTMYDSMRLFYDNGGGFCYVVSIGTYDSEVTGTGYTDAIDKLKEQSDVTILAFPDAATLLDNAKLKEVHVKALAHCAKLGGRFAILDIKRLTPEKDETPTALLTRELKDFRENVADNLCFGAAYYPYLKTSYTKDIQFEDVMAAMTEPADPEAKAIWDKAQALLTSAAPKTSAKGKSAAGAAAEEVKAETDAQIALKIKAIIPQIEGYAEKLAELQDQASVIPPSGAIAGIYAATDARAGVWQAPANVGMAGVKALTRNLTDDQQEGMNVDSETAKSINAIRYFRGKGILVWGSRTLDGGSNEWRYVPVRRLFSYVEQSLKLSTAWAVFQPNDATTWVKLRCQISSFLSTLWRDGALTGSTAEEAFFVEVGKGITMTQDDINNGYLKVRVGLAAVRPAEFIVLEFSHMVQE